MKRILLFFIALTLSSPVYAQYTVGGACTGANRIYTTSGTNTSVLICNGTTLELLEKDLANPARKGIGTETPAAALDVNGEIKVGNTSLSCSGTTEGAIRYSDTNSCIELCNGSSWDCISVAACGDASPAAFNFTDLTNQSTSTQVTSNILQITGLSCTVNVAVSGEGSPQYRTCSDSGCSTVLIDWTSSTGTIDNNDYIQLRLTTSATGGDTYSATLSVGTGADVWDASTTGDCTGSPVAGTVCSDGTVYAGMSPDGNVKMYVTRCDVGMTWNGSTCTGTRSSLPWNAGNTSGYVTTSQTSSVTGESNTGTLASTDADSATGGTQDHVAGKTCNDLSQDGHTDWYLPAKAELNVIYGNKTAIGHFNTGGTYYWSSSEYITANSAWRQRFSDGSQGSNGKHFTSAVRCARR